jgi:ferric-dicitrate binding protein FerR (iron transport regulator)
MTDSERQLVDLYLDAALPESEHASLFQRLETDPEAVAYLAARTQLNVDLRRSFKRRKLQQMAVASAAASTSRDKAMRWTGWLSWRPLTAAAAGILFGLLAFGWARRGVEVEVVETSEGISGDWAVGHKARLNHVALVRGSVQMRLSSGVLLDVSAPIEMNLIDAMHVQVLSGRLTADVGENGKGFVIETPQTRVVDLGTRFGVDASDAAHTDVVVFQGQVELYQTGTKERMALLGTGEALRVENHRRTSRIVSVTGSDESGAWRTQGRAAADAVIASVSDSMIANDESVKKWPSLKNFYRIVPGGLRDGALAFADEIDQWQDVPLSLAGADLVRTFAVDGFNWWMQMSVTVQRPCEVFVFVDMRNEVPTWLSQEFTNTGEKVTLDRISHKAPQRVANRFEFAIWKKTVTQPGEVKLGPPYPNPPADRKSFNPNRMFGVAAKTLP